MAVRGHQEGYLAEDGTLLPMVVERERPIGLCLQTTATVDTSTWRARLFLAGGEEVQELALPSRRMASTVCFERSFALVSADREESLCLEVVDDYDRTRYRVPCETVRFATASGFADLLERRRVITAGSANSVTEQIEQLSELESDAERSGFPFLALRLRLIASYLLRQRGSAADLARAEELLATSPQWLDQPAAAAWSAQLAQEREALGQILGLSPEKRWQLLRAAERDYLSLAYAKRFTVAMRQASLLAQAGAVNRAAEHLRSALAECEQSPCNPALLPSARSELGWLILLDSEATEDDLLEAESVLVAALETTSEAEPLGVANSLLNLAHLKVRRGLDPAPELTRAHTALGRVGAEGRGKFLQRWAMVVEALHHLTAGRGELAAELCTAVGTEAVSPLVATWSRSCLGKAYRSTGDLAAAALAYEQALLLHESTTAERLGETLALSPGRRADDFYEAARVALERSQPEKAWQLLERLDRLALGSPSGFACDGLAASEERRRLEQRRSALVEELMHLELPAAGARRRQRQPIRRELQEEASEILRRLWSCGSSGSEDRSSSYRRAAHRAVALSDEVLLLYRDDVERVSLIRRTPLARGELLQRVGELERMLGDPAVADERWRKVAGPLARALLPERIAPGGTTRFLLHGTLQRVPLAALPLVAEVKAAAGASAVGEVGEASAEPQWLGEVTTVTLLPARGGTRRLGAGDRGGADERLPLFVVDPEHNLESGARLAKLYRGLFPEGVVLEGPEASRSALRAALPQSGWLHLDVHGVYEPAFPELSRLLLADGQVELADLLAWPLPDRLVNLAGCHTGRWPSTADSGRFGLGGLLTARGARWVVASRGDLSDSLAEHFNRGFYRALAAGEAIAEAYRLGLSAMRSRHPAAEWASLMLLEGGHDDAFSDETTPRGAIELDPDS